MFIFSSLELDFGHLENLYYEIHNFDLTPCGFELFYYRTPKL